MYHPPHSESRYTMNRIDRMIRAMTVGAGVVSLIVYTVFQVL